MWYHSWGQVNDRDLPRGDTTQIKPEMRGHGRNEDLVLVGDVQLVENPEIQIPTLVWLQPLDRFLRDLARTFHFSFNSGCELVGSVHDGEACVVRDLLSVMADQIAYQDVEGGAEVVNEVAENERDILRKWGHVFEPNDKFPVGLDLANGGVWLRFTGSDSLSQVSEVSEVFFGPCDLGARSGRWCAGHG